MKISKELENFLKGKYIKQLLLKKDYIIIYEALKNNFTLSISDIGTFSTLLYRIGEDPLVKFTYIPTYFLFGSDLEYFHIPENIVEINEHAFNHCEDLKNIEISNNVKEIGGRAFAYCKSLTKIELPNNVEKIFAEAFYSCNSLININIPATVIFLGDKAFKECKSLQYIDYGGTKDQWENLDKNKKLFSEGQKIIIHCVDGDLLK